MKNEHIADIIFVINTFFPGFIIDKIDNIYGYWEIDIRKQVEPFPTSIKKKIHMDKDSHYGSISWVKVWEYRYVDMSLPLGERKWITWKKVTECFH